MKKSEIREISEGLISVAQLGISLVIPPVVISLGANWLRRRFDLGVWILILGVFTGIMTAISTAYSFYKSRMNAEQKEEESKKRPVSFNDHV